MISLNSLLISVFYFHSILQALWMLHKYFPSSENVGKCLKFSKFRSNSSPQTMHLLSLQVLAIKTAHYSHFFSSTTAQQTVFSFSSFSPDASTFFSRLTVVCVKPHKNNLFRLFWSRLLWPLMLLWHTSYVFLTLLMLKSYGIK